MKCWWPLLFGMTTNVWELQNLYEDSQNKKQTATEHMNCVKCSPICSLCKGWQPSLGSPSPSPPTSAAPENGHHGTDLPSDIHVLWSPPGHWWRTLASLGVLDYSLACWIRHTRLEKATNWGKWIFKCSECIGWHLAGKYCKSNKPCSRPWEPFEKAFGSQSCLLPWNIAGKVLSLWPSAYFRNLNRYFTWWWTACVYFQKCLRPTISNCG